MTPDVAPPCDILIVDDDARMATTLQDFLRQEGYRVEVALSAEEALAFRERNFSFRMALIDLIMPLTDGLMLMERLHRQDPELPVIMMTGYGTIETAVDAIKRGAEDYLTKPFDRQAVLKKVARLMEVSELRDRVVQLEAGLSQCKACFEHLVYVSPLMQRAVERARTAAATDASVLLVGETGTGKEMLARAMHAASPRGDRPFVAVNCGALPRELVESELFGFRRGAFTGAYADAEGIFAAATGGTVFLDEIGEMPKEAQVKILRVLQEKELRPVGSTTTVPVDVRVICASNRPLEALRAECLREDLYYRIATVILELPPLRTRREDVLVLTQRILSRISRRYARQITLGRSGMELLLDYSFPGNVRELENLLESVSATSTADPQVISERELKPLLREPESNAADPAGGQGPLALDTVERLVIERALRICEGNRTKAASLLGISRDTLHRKLREFKLGAV